MNSLFLVVPIFLPIILGAVSFVIPENKKLIRNIFVMATIVCSSVSVWVLALNTPQESLVLLKFTDNLTFVLRLDGAGKIFSCLSATLWPLTALYAFEYMSHEKRLKMFYSFFTMSFGAVMGIAYSSNILTMYLFYELLTLFTIPLVMHGMTEKHNRAARKYMAYSIGGAAFAFAGVAFLIVNDANDFIFGGHIVNPQDPNIALILFVFAFMGFGVKAAVFPLHSWLPTASVAPTPVTALLHAVAVVKAGAFAIIRLIYYIKNKLEEKYKANVVVQNDMKLTALGVLNTDEINSKNIVTMQFGHNGVGMAGIVNGHLIEGNTGFAGEVGYINDLRKNIMGVSYPAKIVRNAIVFFNPEIIVFYKSKRKNYFMRIFDIATNGLPVYAIPEFKVSEDYIEDIISGIALLINKYGYFKKRET